MRPAVLFKTGKYLLKSWAVVAASAAVCSATLITETGVGTRPFGLGNNYVASANDANALYWNPAGFAFMNLPEVCISVNGERLNEQSRFFGSGDNGVRQSVWFGNAAIAMIGPAQNNLGGAIGLQSPYSFLDMQKYNGSFESGGSLVAETKNYRAGGSLNFWSLGGGFQINKNMGVGATFSVVTGTENVMADFTRSVNGVILDSVNDFYRSATSRGYYGYDLRVGLLYSIARRAQVGILLVFPSYVEFVEDTREDFPLVDSGESFRARGHLESAPSGAVGLHVPLRFIRLNGDARFRAPYDGQPETSEASFWKVGGGCGVEVPVRFVPLLVRAGYSFDEFDPYVYLFKYNRSAPQVVDFTASRNRQLITAGAEYSLDRQISVEAAYGYSFWELSTPPGLTEKQHVHRGTVGISAHF